MPFLQAILAALLAGLPGHPGLHTPPLTPKEYAATQVSEAQWPCLRSLWRRESRWQPDAYNPSSGAFGIAQFLPSTWANYGERTRKPRLQIRFGIRYIRDRYGTPCVALEHHTQNGWY